MSVVPILAALGDECRLQIVTKLCNAGPQSISRLADGARISRQAVTKHLHALHKAGLVQSRRRGREHIWNLETSRIDEVRRYLEKISLQWDDALARLRSVVED
ncbi:MAG: helix-turn-helix transcriptional regulator [Candidatus Eremiobacteraeota bacterium]|nr:helix-turn-helix transcriptional regulator [Candidatus Eremiobacteraeota bacterium]